MFNYLIDRRPVLAYLPWLLSDAGLTPRRQRRDPRNDPTIKWD